MDRLVEKLEDDHRQLIPLMETAGAAVTAFESQPDVLHQTTIRDGLVAIRDLFFPHLDVEDAQILPAIAESIPPKEFWQRGALMRETTSTPTSSASGYVASEVAGLRFEDDAEVVLAFMELRWDCVVASG
jgi:hypothetical protein